MRPHHTPAEPAGHHEDISGNTYRHRWTNSGKSEQGADGRGERSFLEGEFSVAACHDHGPIQCDPPQQEGQASPEAGTGFSGGKPFPDKMPPPPFFRELQISAKPLTNVSPHRRQGRQSPVEVT